MKPDEECPQFVCSNERLLINVFSAFLRQLHVKTNILQTNRSMIKASYKNALAHLKNWLTDKLRLSTYDA